MKRRLWLFAVLFLTPAFALFSQSDFAVADRYAQWAKSEIESGRWGTALAGLERARDFAGISSDISYMLALCRSRENLPRGMVLEALETALAVNRWNLCGIEDARLLKAETLIAIKAYNDALAELDMTGSSPREAELALKALSGLRAPLFRCRMSETLDRYPREPGPVRVFFNFLKAEKIHADEPAEEGYLREAREEDFRILELIMRRLPALLLKDSELAWMAAPFVRDRAEAKRVVMAYRAANKPLAASIPIALDLGVIDEQTAIEELFASGGGELFLSGQGGPNPLLPRLDLALLGEIWDLLRNEEAKNVFAQKLKFYTGIITEDANMDGLPETAVGYRNGTVSRCVFDTLQGGVPELTVSFEAGDPLVAEVLLPPEISRGALTAGIVWERFPAVLNARLDGAEYIFRPFDFHYSPFTFFELWGSGLYFLKKDPMSAPPVRRVIVLHALEVTRSSREFSGGREVVRLARGIPVGAKEFIGEALVSETEFLRGRPQLQRVDLDIDGYMETVRFFDRNYRFAEIDELWDYDRIIEYTESDFDRDGIFEVLDR